MDKRIISIENIHNVRYPAIDEGVRKFMKLSSPDKFCVI